MDPSNPFPYPASTIIAREQNPAMFSQIFSQQPGFSGMMRQLSTTTRAADLSRMAREECLLPPSKSEIGQHINTESSAAIFIIQYYYDRSARVTTNITIPLIEDARKIRLAYSYESLVYLLTSDGPMLEIRREMSNISTAGSFGYVSNKAMFKSDLMSLSALKTALGLRKYIRQADISEGLIHTVDVKTYYTIVKNREVCESQQPGSAKARTLAEFDRTIDLLSTFLYSILHLENYVYTNLLVLDLAGSYYLDLKLKNMNARIPYDRESAELDQFNAYADNAEIVLNQYIALIRETLMSFP